MPFDLSDAEAKDAELCAALEDLRPVTDKWADAIVEGIQKNFDDEAAAGERWPALAESTQRDRARKGYGAAGPILVRTGNLKDDAGSFRKVDAESAEVGYPDDHPTAGFHMSSKARSKIPLRDALAQGQATFEKTDRALVEHLEKHKG